MNRPETIAFSTFVRRQTRTSGFSHTELPDEAVLDRVQSALVEAKPSYRKYDADTGVDEKGLRFGGVMVVPVSPEGFFSAVAQLQAGDTLGGVYEARQAGEAPRRRTWVNGREKMPAKSVDIILYHADVLAEDGGRSTEAEWEIISINASPVMGDMPIHPMTLLSNHFQVSGGTKTGLSAEELVEKLREGYEFWSDKAMIGEKPQST